HQRAYEPDLFPSDRLRPIPERPAAVRRTGGPVRVGHDAVQGDELDDDDAHDESPSVRCSLVPTCGTARTHRGRGDRTTGTSRGSSNASKTRGSANTTLCATSPPVTAKTCSVCSRCPPSGPGAYAASAGCPLRVSS